MDVKEFFRPTKGKVILTIVIIILFLLIAYLYNSSFKSVGFESHPNQTYSILLGFSFWPFVISLIIAFNTQINIGVLLAFAIFVELVYVYLMSSILVFIFNKFKKK